MTDFDPHTVPAFPVFHLDVQEGAPVRFNGEALSADEEHGGLELAIEAAAAEARTRGLNAVRMSGTYHGTEHSFVVTADGESFDLNEDSKPQRTLRPSRRLILLLAACSVLVLLVVVGVVMSIRLVRSTPASESTPPPIPGVGAQIPIALPNDWSQSAEWSITVSDDASAQVLTTHGILTTTADGTLVEIDPDRGTPRWKGIDAPRQLENVAETTWAGRPVLAVKNGNELRLWARDLPGHDPVPPTDIPLPNGATVTFAGDSPLIDLGDYTVGVPERGHDNLQRVTVPVGTTPISHRGNEIISLGHGAIMATNTHDGSHTKIGSLSSPSNASGEPTQIIGVSDTKAIVIWKTKQQSQAVYLDTATGDVYARLPTSGVINLSRVQIDRTAHTALVGDLFISTTDEPAITRIDSTSQANLAGRTLYTRTLDKTTAYEVEGSDIKQIPWPSFDSNDPLPRAQDHNALFVVAEQVDHTVLYKAQKKSHA